METIDTKMLERDVAKFALPGQEESGDRHPICWDKTGLLVGAIDDLWHGEEEAANASKTAASILGKDTGE